MNCNQDKTITFDEKVKGWTSFHSFSPDSMIGMNNDFFSFIGGNLYIHHSEEQDRGVLYEESNPSRISLVVNDNPSLIKEVKNISLEGNKPWLTSLDSFIDDRENKISSTILKEEYHQKEGIWYGHARRDEDSLHLDSRSTYGIGVVDSISSDTINYLGGSSSLCIGDRLYKATEDTLELIGIVQNYSSLDIVLEDNVSITLSQGDFLLGAKNSRVEGANLRGYVISLDLEIEDKDRVELFAVNTNISTSHNVIK